MAGALLKVAPEPIPDCWNSYDVYIEGETQLLHFTRIATQPWRFTKHHHAELWGEAFREAWEDGFVSDQDIELACEQFAVEGKNHGLNPSWRKFLQRPPRPDPAVKHPGGTTSPDTESYEQRLQTMPKQLAELPDALFLNSVGNPVDPGQLYSNAEAFLVLNGPSVNRIDLNRLSGPGFLTMGINNGPRAFRPHLWAALDRPSRFVPSLWLDPRILKFTPRKHLVSGRLSTVIDQPGNRIRIKNCPCVVYYACGDLDAKTFLTADTLQTGIPKFRSTSLVALRILYELGVSTVYLLGCDFNMSADNPYFFSENVPGPQVQNNNKAYRTLSGILAELKPVFDDAGFRLFNCNPDSQLDIFPFIEFDDVATLLEQKMAYLKDRESNTDLYYPER